MFVRVTVLLAGLLCAYPVATAVADEPLTDQQLLRLFPGTFKAVIRGKYEARVTVKRNGAIAGEMAGLQEQGRWTVQNGELCIVMPNMTRGRVECSAVVAEGSWYKGRNVSFRKL